MFVLPPETVAINSCPIRVAAQSWADHCADSLNLYTTLVLIGVAIEGIEVAVEVVAWIVRQTRIQAEFIHLREVNEVFPAVYSPVKRRTEFVIPTLSKSIAFIGLILVVIGVGGELRFEHKLQLANNTLQRLDADQILAAQLRAGDAAASAKTAHDEATAATNEADEAKRSADTAESAAGRAGVKATSVAQQAADLQRKYESSEAKRRELEKIIAPRFLMVPIIGGVSIADSLRKFDDISVTIESVSDLEARRAALNLGRILSDAGWNVESNTVVGQLPDGVLIESYEPSDRYGQPLNERERGWADEQESRAARYELNAFLLANDWEADSQWDSQQAAPTALRPKELRISVGLKPLTYFQPEWFKSAGKKFRPPEVEKRANEIRTMIKTLDEVIEHLQRPR
jgi:hypothetical protein